MKFKEWLEIQETMTSTGDIAGFSRIVMPLSRRLWPGDYSDEALGKKKKVKKQPQVEEAVFVCRDREIREKNAHRKLA